MVVGGGEGGGVVRSDKSVQVSDFQNNVGRYENVMDMKIHVKFVVGLNN